MNDDSIYHIRNHDQETQQQQPQQQQHYNGHSKSVDVGLIITTNIITVAETLFLLRFQWDTSSY